MKLNYVSLERVSNRVEALATFVTSVCIALLMFLVPLQALLEGIIPRISLSNRPDLS